MINLSEQLHQLIESRHLTTYGELHELRQELIEQINHWFEQQLSANWQLPPVDHITASSVVLEVIDDESGRIFRRKLPLDFHENDNGIRLGGETINGQSTEIAFLSAKALGKMHDLTGLGADSSHCDHHEHDH